MFGTVFKNASSTTIWSHCCEDRADSVPMQTALSGVFEDDVPVVKTTPLGPDIENIKGCCSIPVTAFLYVL